MGCDGDTKKIVNIIKKISDDATPSLPTNIEQLMSELRENKWPETDYSCFQYNYDQCDRYFVHRNKDDGKLYMHTCAICVHILKVGMHHPAKNCSTLQYIDKVTKTNEMAEITTRTSDLNVDKA